MITAESGARTVDIIFVAVVGPIDAQNAVPSWVVKMEVQVGKISTIASVPSVVSLG